MSRKFNKIDQLGTTTMLGLAILILVKLAPSFLEPKEVELPKELQKQTKSMKPVEEAETAKPNQVKLASVTLPAPPPSEPQQTDQSVDLPTTKKEHIVEPMPAPIKEPKKVSSLKASEVTETVTKSKTIKAIHVKNEAKIEVKKITALHEVKVIEQPNTAIQIEIKKPQEPAPINKPIEIVAKKPRNTLEPEIKLDDIEKFKSIQKSLPKEEMIARPSPTKNTTTVAANNQNVKAVQTGRSLLKFLEHGKGPAIEIIWPNQAAHRDRLYSHLTNCYGMISAILTKAQFYRENQSGPWALNPDMFSGFLRQPTGNLPRDEKNQISRIQQQNGLSRSASAIRLFPRQSDAILLGGLKQLIGPDYLSARHIQGRYTLSSNGLRLTNITVDGLAIDGDIEFQPVVRNCRGAV